MVKRAVSPLSDPVRIRSVTGRSVLRLKSWIPSGDARPTVAGVEFQEKVGMTSPGELRVLCTGPGDWLLVSSYEISAPLRGRIEADALSQGLALADLSSGLTALELAGTGARAVLSKGCGLDFDSRAFAYPLCARTRLAQLAVVVDAQESGEGFDLYVARSHGSWLKDWLTDSALEFR